MPIRLTPDPEPDKHHPCGCVTYWHNFTRQPGAAYYRKACKTHARYAYAAGLVGSGTR